MIAKMSASSVAVKRSSSRTNRRPCKNQKGPLHGAPARGHALKKPFLP